MPDSGKENNIDVVAYEVIRGTMLEHNLRVVGSNRTSVITGECNGAIRELEELLECEYACCITLKYL